MSTVVTDPLSTLNSLPLTTTPILFNNEIEGTGFYYVDGDNLYCITCHHVVEKIFRVDDGRINYLARAVIYLRSEEEKHAVELSVDSVVVHDAEDLAALRVHKKLISDCHIKSPIAVFNKDNIASGDRLKKIPVTTQVAIYGYPMCQCDETHLPLARIGALAYPAHKNYKDKCEGRIHLRTWPGDSGSPVIVLNNYMAGSHGICYAPPLNCWVFMTQCLQQIQMSV